MLEALAGYAIGTLQIVALGWLTNRAVHRSKLRVLRAELRRLAYLKGKFKWRVDGPGSDTLPLVPRLTPTFLEVVSSIDFYLTDEHADDNTQQALLELVDITQSLEHYSQRAVETVELAKTELGDKRLQMWVDSKDLADAYDETMDRFQVQIASALEDVERRLREANTWPQLNRPLGRLPKGSNPSSLPPPSFAE